MKVPTMLLSVVETTETINHEEMIETTRQTMPKQIQPNQKVERSRMVRIPEDPSELPKMPYNFACPDSMLQNYRQTNALTRIADSNMI
jgi:hypothetical protein